MRALAALALAALAAPALAQVVPGVYGCPAGGEVKDLVRAAHRGDTAWSVEHDFRHEATDPPGEGPILSHDTADPRLLTCVWIEVELAMPLPAAAQAGNCGLFGGVNVRRGTAVECHGPGCVLACR